MVTFKFDTKSLEALMQGPEVTGLVRARADAVAARAGDGFTADLTRGNRPRAYVRARDYKAMRRQARDHVLERAIGGI
jgi:hypothetical protein